jgi:small GTP-binding protein
MGYPQTKPSAGAPGKPASKTGSSWTDPIRRGWEAVPEAQRRHLERIVGLAPGTFRRWRDLLESAAENLRLSAGDRRRVAIVGPPNAGKSTLYNRLLLGKQPRAEVSPEAGTTRVPQEGDAGLFSIIDTPGADPAGGEGLAHAVDSALHADVVVALFDAGSLPTEETRPLLDLLVRAGRPRVVALNKMDLVRGNQAGALGSAAGALGLQVEDLVPISARTGAGLERLLTEVARQEPEIVVALGRALPAYRETLARAAVRRAASTAAAIALTPLPMLDFIPLVAVQSALVLGLARIYAYRITLARVRELIATFGLGLLGRTLFHQLAKLGGPPGWLVAASVAAGTTTALGYAATAWFARGEKVSRERLQAVSESVGRSLVGRLGRGRRPRREELEREVRILLDESEAAAPGPSQAADPGGL